MKQQTEQIVFAAAAIESSEKLEPIWRDLEARADCSFFQSWHWIGCWLCETGLRPALVTGRLDGVVVALALLVARPMRRHRWLRANTIFLHETGDPAIDINFIEYNGIVVDRRLGATAIADCLAFLGSLPRLAANDPPWDELYLGGIPQDYLAILESCSLAQRIVARKPTAAIDLATLRAERRDILADLSPNTRHQIRRASRIYRQRGTLRLEAAVGLAQAMRFFDALKTLHQKRWLGRGRAGAFSYPFLERFHRSLITQCLPQGHVELLRISAGDDTIGYLYNFVYRGWVGTYLSGFAYEDDARLKPGLVSYHLCAERHLLEGARVLDFLAGDDRYKTSLGKPGATMYWLAVQRPRLRFRVESALRWLKNAVP
jgi:CelD/BcsL family acetyltransferase involved in cellulose biosynthesis